MFCFLYFGRNLFIVHLSIHSILFILKVSVLFLPLISIDHNDNMLYVHHFQFCIQFILLKNIPFLWLKDYFAIVILLYRNLYFLSLDFKIFASFSWLQVAYFALQSYSYC